MYKISITLLLIAFTGFLFPAYTQSMDTSTNQNISVNFTSMGTGIDYKIHEKFIGYLPVFEKVQKAKLLYEVKPWGREGEKEYYFSLKNLSENQQNALINELQTMFKDNQLVRVQLNIADIREISPEAKHNTVIIDFETLKNAHKADFKSFMKEFEMKHRIDVLYNNAVYEAEGGGEIFTVHLSNFSDTQKKAFTEDVKKQFENKKNVNVRLN